VATLSQSMLNFNNSTVKNQKHWLFESRLSVMASDEDIHESISACNKNLELIDTTIVVVKKRFNPTRTQGKQKR
jgi:hypothetical protein